MGTLRLKIAKPVKESLTDLSAYPILTEEVGYPPSSISTPPMPGGGKGTLGQVAAKAVADVLGWKPNTGDVKGFVGALTQSFTLTEVEGHVESAWNPRSSAVQTDLAGGITGAQASLYTRAKEALDQCLPLLDGLYPLDPKADPEYVRALREMAKSQMTELVREFGVLGSPSILRINTYFQLLLSPAPVKVDWNPATMVVQADPDQISGTLGAVREIYGIWFLSGGKNNFFSNSVDDEENITNFRVISDYVTSLLQSWTVNGQYFSLGTNLPAFLGTQLILISRQFNVIAETVNELRFALDSVFIGPAERQTLLLEFNHGLPAIFLEDILSEIENFMTDEAPRLVKDGGRIAIGTNLRTVLKTQEELVRETKNPANIHRLPDGFRTVRVRKSLDDLGDQLAALHALTRQVGVEIPSRRVIG